MLVQRRTDALRLIRQHDHALLAGALAFSWRAEEGAAPDQRTALAIALHDVVWVGEDERPRLDPTSGAPHDFTTIPVPMKRRFVTRGVAGLRALDPDAAVLVESHHRTLAEGGPVDPDSPLAWLRFFDNLSLFICLTAPGSVPEARPGWLAPERVRPPSGALVLDWAGDARLAVRPFPFGSPFAVGVPYRDLPLRRYQSQAELTAAWEAANEEHWTLHITPAP